MPRDYDRNLSDAKANVTRLVIAAADPKNVTARDNLPGAVDELNKAWDALTDCLVRQRDELQERVLDLINDVAELKKGR